MRIMKKLGSYAVLVAVGLLAFYAVSWARPSVLAWSGRTSTCDAETARSANGKELAKARLRLTRESTVEKVPGSDLLLHKTPRRSFYTPPKTDLYYVLAEQEVQVYGKGPYRVKPGDVVLDCGANVGTFVDEALRAGARLVVAIEPSPKNVEALNLTFAEEVRQGRVIVYPKGVWHQDEVLKFNVFNNSVLDSFVMNDRTEETAKPTQVELPLTTVDKIVAELKLKEVTFIKMDIEGAERKALVGARQTLLAHRPRMSVATENLPDDYLEVPRVIQTIRQDYRIECLWCRNEGWFEVRPDILHFY
jgi:FkbM family methyltransferase